MFMPRDDDDPVSASTVKAMEHFHHDNVIAFSNKPPYPERADIGISIGYDARMFEVADRVLSVSASDIEGYYQILDEKLGRYLTNPFPVAYPVFSHRVRRVTPDSPILLIDQRDADADIRNWQLDAIKRIRSVSKRQIIVRPASAIAQDRYRTIATISTEPLKKDIDRSFAVVSYSGNELLIAASRCVPVYCKKGAGCAVEDAAFEDLEFIESISVLRDTKPVVRCLESCLRYGWTLEEIRDGLPFVDMLTKKNTA